MKKLLVCLFTMATISSYAKEFSVTISEFTGPKTVTTVNLPSDEIITVNGDKAKCMIDATVYNPEDKYSFIALEINDFEGNSSASGGLIENGSAVMMLTLNNNLCLIQELKN